MKLLDGDDLTSALKEVAEHGFNPEVRGFAQALIEDIEDGEFAANHKPTPPVDPTEVCKVKECSSHLDRGPVCCFPHRRDFLVGNPSGCCC